jgi:prepilin-type N-terminal cleavage/methylation domain-containing protein
VPAPRRGMTLVEVIIAIVILTGATLTMGGFVSRFAHSASLSTVRASAVELAVERLESVKQGPAYDQLEASFEREEATVAGYPGFSRSTVVSRVSRAGIDDYTLVTVVVRHESLPGPVKKTTIVSAF